MRYRKEERWVCFFLMIRRRPRPTQSRSSAASDVYKRRARDGRAREGVAAATTKSSATDMVTEFDRASEALIVRGIHAARPHDAIVGEEGTDAPGTSGVHWLIDPIDGTTNFLYGLPGWAVSIAALTSDGAQVGAVFVLSLIHI